MSVYCFQNGILSGAQWDGDHSAESVSGLQMARTLCQSCQVPSPVMLILFYIIHDLVGFLQGDRGAHGAFVLNYFWFPNLMYLHFVPTSIFNSLHVAVTHVPELSVCMSVLQLQGRDQAVIQGRLQANHLAGVEVLPGVCGRRVPWRWVSVLSRFSEVVLEEL